MKMYLFSALFALLAAVPVFANDCQEEELVYQRAQNEFNRDYAGFLGKTFKGIFSQNAGVNTKNEEVVRKEAAWRDCLKTKSYFESLNRLNEKIDQKSKELQQEYEQKLQAVQEKFDHLPQTLENESLFEKEIAEIPLPSDFSKLPHQFGCYKGYCWKYRNEHAFGTINDPWCYTQRLGAPVGNNADWADCGRREDCTYEMTCGNNISHFGND